VQAGAFAKADPPVQCGSGVVGKHVEKRRFAPFPGRAGEMRGYGGTKTPASHITVDADRAQLDKAGKPDALPTHRQQPTVITIAEITAEQVRACAERAWIGVLGRSRRPDRAWSKSRIYPHPV
jgi:hypothetical protein